MTPAHAEPAGPAGPAEPAGPAGPAEGLAPAGGAADPAEGQAPAGGVADPSVTRSQRLDRLPFTRKHGKLLVVSGLGWALDAMDVGLIRSEEHTSELQSRGQLVCRLLPG